MSEEPLRYTLGILKSKPRTSLKRLRVFPRNVGTTETFTFGPFIVERRDRHNGFIIETTWVSFTADMKWLGTDDTWPQSRERLETIVIESAN